MDLLYFVLLVSSLIFIHESGHFAFAKIFGVKVLTFSIGFGPKIVRIRGKETEYCIAAVPLGGFVKMLEESKRSEPILPEERGRTFESQALWKRVVIVLAGPAMNVLFPVALYTSVFLDETQFLPPTVGVVVPGKPAEGKLEPGDRITSVDGEAIISKEELDRLIEPRAGKAVKLGVERDGKNIEVVVTPADEAKVRELDIVEHRGQLGFDSHFPAAAIGISRPGTPAAAGLRSFDLVTAVNGKRIERFIDLIDALSANRGDQIIVSFLRPVDAWRVRWAAWPRWGCSSRARRRSRRCLRHAPRRGASGRRERARGRRPRAHGHRERRHVRGVRAGGVERVARGAATGRPHHDARRRAAAPLAVDARRAGRERRQAPRAAVGARGPDDARVLQPAP